MYTQPHPEGQPQKVIVVGGGSEGGGGSTPTEPKEISLLAAGNAAGTINYPTGTASKSETDIMLNFGSSNEATTGQFSTFLVDLNGKESVFPGIRSNISIAQVTTCNVGDVVNYTIPAGCKLRIKHTAATGGGTLSIKGVVG